jgi:hypothetical protein
MTDPGRGGIAGPRQRWGGGQAASAEVSSGEVAGRVFRVIWWVTQPVAAMLTLIAVWLIARQRRVRPLWFAASGAAVLSVSGATGLARGYWAPWRELARRFRRQAGAHGKQQGSWGRWAADHWAGWVLGQLPSAVAAALVVAGFIGWRRSRFTASWRKTEPRAAKSEVQKALAELGPWPPQEDEVPADTGTLRVRLGVDRRTAQPCDIPAAALGKHAYLEGPSGFGKTTALAAILSGLVAAPAARPLKIPVVFITMKPDRDLDAAMRAIARVSGRRLHIITEDGRGATGTYNPIKHGTAEQVKNKLIEAEAQSADGGFSEPHHRRVGERFVLKVVTALTLLSGQGAARPGRNRAWRRDMIDLAALMDLGTLGRELDKFPAALQSDLTAYVAMLRGNKDLQKSIIGMRERFALVAEGATGTVFTERPDGLDLLAALRNGDLVLFNLDAAADTAAARHVGNLAIQDLTLLLSSLADDGWARAGNMAFIVVDEFSALGGSLLANLYARARSQGAGVALATQQSESLRDVSEAFEAAVIENSNILLLGNQTGKADDRASEFGTDQRWSETIQVRHDADPIGTVTEAGGVGSLRMVDAFRIHPNELRDLQPGEMVLRVKAPYELRHIHILRGQVPVTDADYIASSWTPPDDERTTPAAGTAKLEPAPAADPWDEGADDPTPEDTDDATRDANEEEGDWFSSPATESFHA